MTTEVNLIHGKKNAHSSEEFSGEWAVLYNGILYMSLANFSMEVAIWGMKFPLFIWQVSALSALLFTFSSPFSAYKNRKAHDLRRIFND